MDAEMPVKDHDLLIEVNTNVKNLTTTLHSYTSAASLQAQDHEQRLRTLEAANQKLEGAQKSQKSFLNWVSVIGAVAMVALTVVMVLRGQS